MLFWNNWYWTNGNILDGLLQWFSAWANLVFLLQKLDRYIFEIIFSLWFLCFSQIRWANFRTCLAKFGLYVLKGTTVRIWFEISKTNFFTERTNNCPPDIFLEISGNLFFFFFFQIYKQIYKKRFFCGKSKKKWRCYDQKHLQCSWMQWIIRKIPLTLSCSKIQPHVLILHKDFVIYVENSVWKQWACIFSFLTMYLTLMCLKELICKVYLTE